MDNYTLQNLTGYSTASASAINGTLDTIVEHSNNSSLTVVYSAIQGIDPVAVIADLAIIIIIIIGTKTAAKIADRMLQNYFLKIADRMLRNRFLAAGDIQAEAEKTRTANLIVRRLVIAAIYTIGLILVILQVPHLNRIAVTFLAGAGLAGLAVGFAAKDALANLIAGVMIAVFQPFRVGDYVTFKGEYGYIEDITLRHTVICTWDKRRVVVPNSMISTETIINWSLKDPVTVWTVEFMIQRASDIDRSREIILEEARKHPNVLKDRSISVLLTEMTDEWLKLRLSFNVPSREVAFDAGCDIREAARKRLDLAGVL